MTNNKSQKVAEIISVLRIFFEKTSKGNTLKNYQIEDISKNEYGIEIERRRLADIINAIEDISNTNPMLMPYRINTSGNKFYRDGFILSNEDIDLIMQTLNESSLISDIEKDSLEKNLKSLQSIGYHSNSKTRNKKVDLQIKDFRHLKNLAKKKMKEDNGARFFTFDYDSITENQMYIYPKIPLNKTMGLNGFVIDIIDCDDEAYICLFGNLRINYKVCEEYPVLMILPLSKINVNFNKPKDDWSLDEINYNLSFKYGNNKNYKDAFEAIEDYKQGKDSILFNFEVKYLDDNIDIIESRNKIVKTALKKFYHSQYDKLKFIQSEDKTIHVKFISTLDRFYKFYCSNIKLLGILGVVSPDFVACKLAYYSEQMNSNNIRHN